MHLRRVLLGIFLMFLSMSGFAQLSAHSFIKNFAAQVKGDKIHINWTTKAGFTCQDIGIELSSDSIQNFDRVGTYFGLCGDTSEKHYTYVIENPILNRKNYIKLELGNYGFSNVISILVINSDDRVIILPHPATSQSTLFFENSVNEDLNIDFYSSNGSLINSTSTRENKLYLGDLQLPKGIVFYHIYGPKSSLHRGKIVVKFSF